MNYRIGLDIGITSVGWAVIDHNESEEPNHIIDLGVRCFDRAEIPKTGASLASERRKARGNRRRLRRRRHRLDRIKLLFEEIGLIKSEELEDIFGTSNHTNVYELRNKALHELISNEEFAVILYHIAKHRGFKSNRKSESTNDEVGKLLKATSENKSLLEAKGYLTVGEMLYKDDKFKTFSDDGKEILAIRNTSDSYTNTVLRDMLCDEVNIIFEKQRLCGNINATKDFEVRFIEIFTSQRPFDLGPGNMPNGEPSPYGGDLIEKMLGKCTFEKHEERACKATYSFQYFVLLQGINNLKIKLSDSTTRRLNEDERKNIIELAHKSPDIDYLKIRKTLNLSDDMSFSNLSYGNKNIVDVEKKTKFNYLNAYHEIRKKFNHVDKDSFSLISINELNDIGRILTVYKNDEKRIEKLQDLNIKSCIIEELLSLNYSKTGNLSVTAIQKITPYLEKGYLYHESCEKAGYNFNSTNNGNKEVYLNKSLLEDIPNPVVCRAISQSIKVINAIIRKYGSPQLICIELAREMSKNFDERKKIEKTMKENSENNEVAKEVIRSLGVINPTGFDIVKYKLWKEQNEVCAYSGKHISVNDLFDKNIVDIDHIIPYSTSFDDSYKNKVLVFSEENRQKGNRLPYEYFGNDEDRWHQYEVFVSQIKNYEKRLKLLKRKITAEDKNSFKERNLQDTKYITTQLFNHIINNLQFAESKCFNKKNVRSVNGAITSYLRKNWGLTKIREDGDKHHALDAVVIACTTDSMIQKISRYVKGRELKYSRNKELIDENTGEVINMSNISRDNFDILFGAKFPEPWSTFRAELDIRMGDNPNLYIKELIKFGYINEEVKPIFVSRMPKHNITGAGHEATIKSPKIIEDGYTVLKTKLVDLKWNKKCNEIEGYYNKEDDKLLYNALCERLINFNYDAKKAFSEPFRKPKSDGTAGPIVKKVKIKEKQTLGVLLNVGKGIAKNGDMIRIDVFNENGKYYFVPIYASDTLKEELPNKAVLAHKKYEEWKDMSEDNFLFSLFSRDLIIFKNKTGINGKNSNDKNILINDTPMYFKDANISKASIGLMSHDKSIIVDTLYIQNLEYLKKLQVDLLGNISEVKKEKRMKFK